jgi:hypothetical protein
MVIVDEDRRIVSVAVFCGIDWAEDHHDIALVDQDGILARIFRPAVLA